MGRLSGLDGYDVGHVMDSGYFFHDQWHRLSQFHPRNGAHMQEIGNPTRLASSVKLVFRCQVLLAEE